MSDSIRPLSEAERLDWLRLIRSENVGPITFHRLIEHYGSAARALEALPDLARRGGRTRAFKVCPKAVAERELAAARVIGAVPLCLGEPEYPALLGAVDDAPPLLYRLGHAQVLTRPAVALVGARNSSANGQQFARKLAAELGRAGLVVVSGLARGLDTAAHEGSLSTGTVAVMAGGVDVIYPPENARLHQAIAEQGAVVSEMPPGTEPLARHFPRRNRIISGIAHGVVVVEATARSGSLITARLAAEQGREVMAVPGSPLDARCEGPNQLIKDGATLVRGAGDVIDTLRPLLHRPLGERPKRTYSPPPTAIPGEAELASARQTVFQLLSMAPLAVDELIRQCQLSATVVATILLELELAGRVHRHPGNRVSRAAD